MDSFLHHSTSMSAVVLPSQGLANLAWALVVLTAAEAHWADICVCIINADN